MFIGISIFGVIFLVLLWHGFKKILGSSTRWKLQICAILPFTNQYGSVLKKFFGIFSKNWRTSSIPKVYVNSPCNIWHVILRCKTMFYIKGEVINPLIFLDTSFKFDPENLHWSKEILPSSTLKKNYFAINFRSVQSKLLNFNKGRCNSFDFKQLS